MTVSLNYENFTNKKVGHGGTLDPDVDGVLPICIGKGTKVIEYLQDSGKIYEGEITLGFSTTTEDRSGEIVEKKAVDRPLTEAEIDRVNGCFYRENQSRYHQCIQRLKSTGKDCMSMRVLVKR